jgi:hypothetical protein
VLSTELQFIARLLATGQVLIHAEDESGDIELVRSPNEIPASRDLETIQPLPRAEREPWRRGRPLR